jgi:hypothetical protein
MGFLKNKESSNMFITKGILSAKGGVARFWGYFSYGQLPRLVHAQCLTQNV